MNWNDFDTALFDLDGVLTPTADEHMRAWEQMFGEFLRSRSIVQPYQQKDYFDYIDGKPRYDGVRSFLASRKIVLPDGDPSDVPSAETVCAVGNRKNVVFNQVLQDEGVQPYPGSVALLAFLAEVGKKVAVVSSSRNATAVLQAAGLAERFTVVVDGLVANAKGIAGKPSPDTFIYAADQLSTPVSRSVVLEDAISGVEAGRDGKFGLVVGVDRGVGEQRLRDAGAHIVVTDLAELVTR